MADLQAARTLPRYFWHGVFGAIGLLHVLGLPIEIMEIDAAQYASIAREMWEGGAWLEVMHRGEDYLDKPPLLFWTSALSVGLFGYNPVAYKLPALLFAGLGVYSTFKLASRYYALDTARFAALALAGCLYTLKSTNDVRTDTHLMGAVAFASWQLLAYWDTRGWRPLLLAAFGIGLAMLAKGPIGLIVPASGLFVHMLVKHEWQLLADWRFWVVMPVVIGVVLAPMLWGLWTQWGGKGIYFYFWKQSFGRITGENEWRSDGGFSLFFFYSLLWMFLPLTPLLLAALVRSFGRLKSLPEAFSVGAFLLPFLALSFSRYKLDHYIYVCFPFAAVLSAGYVEQLSLRAVQGWCRGLWALLFLLFALFAWIATWMFEQNVYGWVGLAVWICGAVFLWWHLRGTRYLQTALVPTVLLAVGVLGLAMNTALYPRLMTYQTHSAILGQGFTGRWPQYKYAPADSDKWVFYRQHGHLVHFYLGYHPAFVANVDSLPDEVTHVWTDQAGALEMHDKGLYPGYTDACQSPDTSGAWAEKRLPRPESFCHFHAARMTLTFINPTTRHAVLEKRYLVQVALRDSTDTH